MKKTKFLKEGFDTSKIILIGVLRKVSDELIDMGYDSSMIMDKINTTNIRLKMTPDGAYSFSYGLTPLFNIKPTSYMDDLIQSASTNLINWFVNQSSDVNESKIIDRKINKIISESLTRVLNEASKGNIKKKYIRMIYKNAAPFLSNIFKDDDWRHVSELLNNINNVVESNNGELNVWCENGGYWKRLGEFPNYKEYKLTITFVEEDIEINGSIKCHTAGTMEDTFGRYDITLTLW